MQDAPIILSHNSFLSGQADLIRTRSIPWEGYFKANLITKQELEGIAEIKDTSKDHWSLFVSLLEKLSRIDTLQSLLVLIDDYITNLDSVVETKQQKIASMINNHSKSLGLFMKLLSKEDEFIQLMAAKISAFLFSLARYHDLPLGDQFKAYLQWLFLHLNSSKSEIIDISLQYLQTTLAVPAFKSIFFDTEGSVTSLMGVLKKDSTFQIQYQTIYCIWLLTFDTEICQEIEQEYHIIPVLKEIAKNAIKEKVVRIILATFKNLILKASRQNMVPMLGAKVLDIVEQFSVRKWSDEEIMDDIKELEGELKRHVDLLT